MAAKKKQYRLNLRRSKPAPEQDVDAPRQSTFWRWFLIVALLHVLVIGGLSIAYYPRNTPPPPEQFISLVPAGDVVKGTPGTQSAPKLGPTTPAPAKHHTPPPQPAPEPVAVKTPPTPKTVTPPKPVVKPETPVVAHDKPMVKPPPPTKPKVKVDLSQLVDGPVPDKPVKAKTPPKKHVAAAKPHENTDASDRPTDSSPDSSGLSAQQIAQKLGNKLDSSGVKNAEKHGTSGSTHAQENPFADFYLSVRDQVMSKWEHPNLQDDTAVNPKVMIHVTPDGGVPPESVTLVQSSGNATYDESALTAARSLGHLLQPLPEGCPPDISITFKLTR